MARELIDDLAVYGMTAPAHVYHNLAPAQLYDAAIRRREGEQAAGGALVVRTGPHTGRSPNDKFIVREPSSDSCIWWGKVNRPFDPERFAALLARVGAFLNGTDLFVQDCLVGADPAHRRQIRVITHTAWHSLFARTLFIPPPLSVEDSTAGFTLIHAPGFQADPTRDGTNSSTAIILDFGRRLVLIVGTSYAGEIKKSIFTVMNYVLPLEGVLSMHCAANRGRASDVALFFGLSGTGKTSLSADPQRTLIGDDEHGWSARGVFNLEGGCYAKAIRLSSEAEPQIYATTRRPGTILENVVMDPRTRQLDLDDDSLTENTRAAYPIGFIPNAAVSGLGLHPTHIIMLTCDAFGVLPPLAKLTGEQAMNHFLCGYTAKVAGTEQGVTEPQATFSPCFGGPFLALPPKVYADLLGEQTRRHRVNCWLINTGWTGGPYGTGHRIPIGQTRAMVTAALTGQLATAPTTIDPVFGLATITRCPGVPDSLLDPRSTWADPHAYDARARELADKFQKTLLTL